jgi:NADPH2:quinone reductase
MEMRRIITIVGARPQFIKAAAVSRAFADWNEARLRNLRIAWELMLSPMYYDLVEAQAHHRHILEQCASMMEQGALRVHVEKTFPLEQAADAHRELEQWHNKGKLVLTM